MSTKLQFIQIARPAVISPTRKAVWSALLYLVPCAAYIMYSGHLAARAAETRQQLQAIETIKGFVFLAVTGAIFFVISYVRWRRIRRQEEAILAQENTLLQAERKLVAAVSVATVAHDMNNLLMSFSGLVEDLKDRERGDPSLLEMRNGIETGIDKLSLLSKRLVSSVDRAIPEKKKNVDVKTALYELVSIVQKHPDARSCSISMPDIAPLILVLNRTLFEQAVLNLLINAAQATGSAGRIEVRLTTEPGAAIMAIHDNGQGVPDDLVENIFDPCFTTKPDGTGIGLLTVKAFAQSCGADISVGRSPLGGALFQLRIPIK